MIFKRGESLMNGEYMCLAGLAIIIAVPLITSGCVPSGGISPEQEYRERLIIQEQAVRNNYPDGPGAWPYGEGEQ